jgi:hypothetical protein
MKKQLMAVIALVGMLVTGIAQAELKDNNDGTITDTLQGLVWLKNANCFSAQKWFDATNNANALSSGMCGLTDKSSAGQWRIPNENELKARMANKAGFTNLQPDYYWSSTTDPTKLNSVYCVYTNGISNGFSRDSIHYVWPVRSRK